MSDTMNPLEKIRSNKEKRSLPDLAIFGGELAFSQPLHVGRPNIGDRADLTRRIEDILDSAWLTNNGPYLQEFERRICELTGVAHCVCVCNGTVGLELAIRALGMTGEVIVPSFTFVATPHALQWQQIQPVFCDVDPTTHAIDPDRIEELITPRTTGIIGVHIWGRAAAPDQLKKIADKNGLKLLFDAAHAFGCMHHGISIGNFGNAEVFSFHATKFINCFEGGAVVTNDAELAQKIRMMRNFGFTGYDRVDYVGTNGKMSEVSAAMGLTSLESMDHFVAHYRRCQRTYSRYLGALPGVSLYQFPDEEKYNEQYAILELDLAIAPLTRDELVEVLHAENVLARRYFHPGCHQMEPYRSLYPFAHLSLPSTEKLVQCVLSLPTGPNVSDADIQRIVEIIQLVWRHPEKVRDQLASYKA
jgi:dTDP-4-amino-4,6-dideoxygalactose transaminase